MRVFLFPGQGSQAKGMGKHLFDKYNDLTALADRVLGYSIKELCLEDPRRELGQTQFTQPAIYVVSALSYYEKLEQNGQPDSVAGHSLGEFNALLAAGCFDFETGLKLVQKRAELMSQAAEGGMAAVLNSSAQDIQRILAENNLDEIDVANFNAPAQIVISGSKRQIAKAQDYFQQGRTQYIPLNTSGAFHSRYMAPARERFEAFLKQFQFQAPAIPVIANVSATPYQHGDVVENLSKQITGSVRWVETIEYLLNDAAAKGVTVDFAETGYGDVLTKLVDKIRGEWLRNHSAAPPKPATAEPVLPSATPQERVQRWNRECPIGTRVKSTVVPGETLETRTEAMLLFQHRAAVYLKGYSGYFDIEELVPVRG